MPRVRRWPTYRKCGGNVNSWLLSTQVSWGVELPWFAACYEHGTKTWPSLEWCCDFVRFACESFWFLRAWTYQSRLSSSAAARGELFQLKCPKLTESFAKLFSWLVLDLSCLRGFRCLFECTILDNDCKYVCYWYRFAFPPNFAVQRF